MLEELNWERGGRKGKEKKNKYFFFCPLALQLTSRWNSGLDARHNFVKVWVHPQAKRPKHAPSEDLSMHSCHAQFPLLAPHFHPRLPEFGSHYWSISYAFYIFTRDLPVSKLNWLHTLINSRLQIYHVGHSKHSNFSKMINHWTCYQEELLIILYEWKNYSFYVCWIFFLSQVISLDHDDVYIWLQK